MLFNGTCGDRTDVWGWGVTLWEILSNGSNAYGTKDEEQIKTFVKSGGRLTRPPIQGNEAVFNMMERCWRENQEERPTIVEINQLIGDVIGKISEDDPTFHPSVDSQESISNRSEAYDLPALK
eukprot:TRINITY_DN4213_c0_g1_i6.p1 TRINITY_DN4213_c0_g1~~TRINITY_DN4213_c0_g1_i6.p1  ORF type:complete len:123 (+),score=46.26 TRINITY_DN4213_c0_g1_i6:107-475(+)